MPKTPRPSVTMEELSSHIFIIMLCGIKIFLPDNNKNLKKKMSAAALLSPVILSTFVGKCSSCIIVLAFVFVVVLFSFSFFPSLPQWDAAGEEIIIRPPPTLLLVGARQGCHRFPVFKPGVGILPCITRSAYCQGI